MANYEFMYKYKKITILLFAISIILLTIVLWSRFSYVKIRILDNDILDNGITYTNVSEPLKDFIDADFDQVSTIENFGNCPLVWFTDVSGFTEEKQIVLNADERLIQVFCKHNNDNKLMHSMIKFSYQDGYTRLYELLAWNSLIVKIKSL